ncbi:MAG: helix-hairpin-helix domain-containing protein [Caldilineales bacterium]|nr:helix-hairpin-helix domain-containing protein [Caldilineales bacterium]
MPPRRESILVAAATSLFWLLLFGAYLLFGQRRPPAQPIQIATVAPTAVAIPVIDATPAPLRVYVSGAVQAPGVYRLPPGSLVDDAIRQAGGGQADADLVAVNLAHPLADGEQIYVPRQGEAPAPPLLSTQAGVSDSGFQVGELPAAATQILDLNHATAAELETLPGIGPKTAEAIIAGRPYGSVEDLLRVKGIGEKTLEKLRPFIKVE